MSLPDVDRIARKGFPKDVITIVNELVDRENRELEVKFDTNSLNYQAKVIETPEKTTIVLPRSRGAGDDANTSWAPINGTNPNKVKISSDHSLLINYTLDDIATITNINNEFTINVNQMLYLDVEYTAFAISAITLRGGNRWTEYSTPYKITGGTSITDPSVVINSYFLLAYGAALSDDSAKNLPGPIINGVKIVRCVSSPLIINLVNFGAGFIIPYPVACGSRNGPPA